MEKKEIKLWRKKERKKERKTNPLNNMKDLIET